MNVEDHLVLTLTLPLQGSTLFLPFVSILQFLLPSPSPLPLPLSLLTGERVSVTVN